MYEKIDNHIKELSKKSSIQPLGNYDARINDILENLPVTNTNVRRISTWQRAAAAIAICLLSISSAVVAANYVVSERLQNMTAPEIAEYSDNEQMTNENADSYSRTLTAEEQGRLADLRKAYELEGEFPISQLPTVVCENDIDFNQMCYVITDSLFYFPERELKDEELLQYIDFCTKRDYSIAKTWQESSEAKAEMSLDTLDASQALQKSVDLVQKVFGEDVSGYEYDMELMNKDEGVSNSRFVIYLKKDGLFTHGTSIDAESGDFSVRIIGEYVGNTEMQVDEEVYKNNYNAVIKLLRESFEVQDSDIEEALMTYEKKNNNILANRDVIYAIKTKDDAGYVVRYSVDSWKCIRVDFYREYSSYIKLMESQIVTAEKMNNTLCVVSLDAK